MKINKITLFNIGPYVDLNVFDLNYSDDKNIVLIGGKNGAGKTTFFKSIKTCLYGCKVWGFDANCKEYFNIIKSMINSTLQYDNAFKGYIELDLLLDDGKENNVYTIHREWQKRANNIYELFFIYKNGILLLEEEKLNFVSYLISIIPPDMFNFYFFDGEAIADFFLGSNGEKNFKNAFLKLYNLDTISIMVENFERFSNKKSVRNDIYEQYINVKNNYFCIQEVIDNKKKKINDCEKSLDLLQMKKKHLNDSYKNSGGVELCEWKRLTDEIIKEDLIREDINKKLKDIANNNIPFLILENQLRKLKENIYNEKEIKKFNVINDFLNSKSLIEMINDLLYQKNINDINTTEILSTMKNHYNLSKSNDHLFDLSESDEIKVLSMIESKLSFTRNDINTLINAYNKSINKNKKLKDRLSKCSINEYEMFIKTKSDYENDELKLMLEIEKDKQELQLLEIEYKKILSDYNKLKENYEKVLLNNSVNDLSQRAVGVYSLLEEKLILRQSKILEKEFIKCFKKIINKNNFIDGIVVDKNINLIPYKFVEVSFLQIDNYVKENVESGFLSLFDCKYNKYIDDLKKHSVDSVKLPSIIKSAFSQGERQVYIMSVYLALLKTSNKDIPFFIDTPFARIDSKHRSRIVTEFFKVIKNQIFILSTDEEIVGKYKKQIDSKLSDVYLLSCDDYSSTNVVAGKYF